MLLYFIFTHAFLYHIFPLLYIYLQILAHLSAHHEHWERTAGGRKYALISLLPTPLF